MKLVVLIVILLIPSVNAYLIINEVMYNPVGSDNNQEYVELITDEVLNLTTYTLQDRTTEDTLTLLQEANSSYILIVEEEFDYSNLNATIYTTGATIGNNLNNEYDAIILKDQEGNIVDVFSYSENQGANDNAKSLCHVPDASYIIKECTPTPGNTNTEEEGEIEISLEVTEFLANPLGYDDALMPEGEWIELFNSEEYEVNLEGFIIKDNANHKIIIDNTRVSSTVIPAKGYLTVYTNGFSGLLNNEDLEIIKVYTPKETLIDQVSYSSTEEGLSWSKFKDVWHITLPTPSEENKELEEDELESSITIEEIYQGSDETVAFGQQVNIKVEVAKGNTSKYSVEAYITGEEKISKVSKVSLYTKFTNYTLSIPIQLEPNCKEKLKDGTYTIVVEGLDAIDEKEVQVQGITDSLCEEKIVEKTKEKKIYTQAYTEDEDIETVINRSAVPLSSQTVYESTNQESKSIAIYLLALGLIIITIVSTIKHEVSNKSNN